MNEMTTITNEDGLEINYCYDEHDGVASYFIDDNALQIYGHGEARVSPEDKDMESELTGLSIAEMRATRDYYAQLINRVLIPEWKIYKHLYSCFGTGDKYNEMSAEATLVYRKMKQKEGQIKELRELRREIQTDIYNFIKEKEEFYKKVRAGRK